MGSTSREVISAPPAPSPSETARGVAQARLEFDPQIAAQTQQIQEQFLPQQVGLQTALAQQFAPQLSQLFTDIQAQQLPQLQAIQAANFPLQSQVLETAAGRVLEGLRDPSFISPEQQAAIEGTRGRAREQVQRQARGRAQLGGQLFGGRAEQLETRALGELEQAFASEDVNRRLQAQQIAFQNALPFINILFPQAGSAGQVAAQSPFQFTSAVPSPNAQLNAVTQLLGQQTVIPGQPSPIPGLLGTLGGAFLGGPAGAALGGRLFGGGAGQ